MNSAIEQLKLSEFRRFVVAGSFPKYGTLADAIRKMQFVQADPIRSPARAQDLILRQRVDGYVAGDLEERYPKLRAEEGYLFAYGFMTPSVWQLLRYRPKVELTELEREVLTAVSEIGEAHPRSLDERFGRKSVKNPWGGSSKQTKQILEKLHDHGHLRICRRENGIRVYQVPEHTVEKREAELDRYRLLALTTAQVFGPTTVRFLISELRNHNYLLPSRVDRIAAIESLAVDGKLVEVSVDGLTYLLPKKLSTSACGDAEDRVRILAPFDPLVRNRERFEQLWGWSYRFEAYIPAAQRQRGYYAMPLLWRDTVIGWSNATVIDGRLRVELGYIDRRPQSKLFRQRAEEEVQSLARFLGLDDGAWELVHGSDQPRSQRTN